MIVATTSSALFDLTLENQIFLEQGEKAYSEYQIDNEHVPLAPGYAYHLITKLLRLNALGLGNIVEVILLSRNSGDSGLRVMKSIAHYGLAIERAAFSCGENPHLYAKAFNASIFLSANPSDVTAALASGTPAALIVTGNKLSPEGQIRIAFDGDAVLFSDESEAYFQEHGLAAFNENEKQLASIPMTEGPLKPFLEVVHHLQTKFPEGNCPVRTGLITARGAPAHERVIKTLRSWNIRIDEMLFLGGKDKSEFAKSFAADLFFDDQKRHVESVGRYTAAAHVPSGIKN